MNKNEIPVRPGHDVFIRPTGETGRVQMQSGLSSLVRIGDGIAWFPTCELTVVEP